MILSLAMLLGTGALPISAVTRSSMDRSSIVDGENDGFELPVELPIELPIEVSDGPTILTSDDEEIAEGSKILNYVDADEFDSAKHVRRLHALEQLNTYVFQNFDGSRSVYMMDENVKYVDENGDVREKDISLKSILGGFGITESDIELLIPLMPTSGIELGHLGYNLKLIPQNVMSTLASQIGNSVVYNSVYGSDTKLKYTPLLSGIKEDIILNEYTENASYSFVLETDGLALFENQNGRYLAVNENSDPLFYIGNVIVYDAVGKPDIGEMTVETLTQGERYLLTVSAHDEFLSDPDTVYPVTVDPSITISDSSVSGSIIDAPVFKNYPDRNCGNYVYNTVGTTSSSYGIGRTAVKLPGLLSNNDYLTITSSQIKSVKFYAKEGSGGGSQYINLYPLTSNTAWNESDVTWNNVGSYTTTLNCGASSSGGAWSTFDITALVKGWKDNKYPADAGFILINSTESNKRCFLSSEYSTSSDRPYVVFEYEPLIYIGPSTISAYEGSTLTLSATTRPSGQSVTWSSSNTSIATISQSGNFTAVKAGHCEITATFYDSDGVLHTGYADVTVLVPSGVYYITNLNSGYYLNVRACRIAEGSIVNQSPTYAASAPAEASLSEMWKINRVNGDKYSIRPMSKLDMGLHVTGTNVDIYGIGTTDNISAISESAFWTIEWQSTGYVFKKNGDASGTLQIRNSSTIAGDPAAANNYVDNTNCRWTLSKIASPPSGVYLYDTAKKAIVKSSRTETINVGETKSLSDFNLVAIAYSGSKIDQTFTWSSSDSDIATIDGNGVVEGVFAGNTVIAGCVYRNNKTYSVNYTICVKLTLGFTMAKLDELYNVALEYSSTSHDAACLVMQFIRRTKYSGSSWNTVAGNIDFSFVDYVETNYPSLYRYFTVDNVNDYYYPDPNGEGNVDFVHLCATMNGLLYDSEGFKAAVVGEANIDNLCGWAGDLQTLCIDVLGATNNSNNYDTIYSATYEMIGSEDYTFSTADLLADTDAYNVFQLLNNSYSNFIDAFLVYYDKYVGTRYTRFTNGWDKGEIYNCVRNYTTNIYFLFVDWPLLNGYSITDTQANAIASAFTDYIWGKIQNEQ